MEELDSLEKEEVLVSDVQLKYVILRAIGGPGEAEVVARLRCPERTYRAMIEFQQMDSSLPGSEFWAVKRLPSGAFRRTQVDEERTLKSLKVELGKVARAKLRKLSESIDFGDSKPRTKSTSKA